MSDLNDLSRPVTTDTEPNVLDTLRAHIIRAATWSGWTSTTNKVAGLMSAVTSSASGGRALRLYRRNDGNTTDEEIVNLPGMNIGGNAASASTAKADSELRAELDDKAPINYKPVSTWSGAGAIASNVANGPGALGSNTTGFDNTATGVNALTANLTGDANTAFGKNALASNSSADFNSSFGSYALSQSTVAYSNSAFGAYALEKLTSGYGNAAFGSWALQENLTGRSNAAFGDLALSVLTTGNNNTAFGYKALSLRTSVTNATGVGSLTEVTGSNQVQLGDSATTTYVYGTVQNRSDERDKADIRDTVLGLDFVLSLRPVDYRLDMREDYRPERPADLPADATPAQIDAHTTAIANWLEACKLKNIVRDGSKKRIRFHHGFIAGEVKQIIEDTGVDFGGYQDHSLAGGDDVQSLGYDEYIGPMVKATQQLSEKCDQQAAKIIELEALINSLSARIG